MSWTELDIIEVTEQSKWYHSDRADGRIFKVELDLDATPNQRPQKLVVRRWGFDTDGERYYFGQSRNLWTNPKRNVLDLGIGDPELHQDAGLAFYASPRYQPYGIYQIYVWDKPDYEPFVFPFTTGDLDDAGLILIPHNLRTLTPFYALTTDTGIYVNPNGVRMIDKNVLELDVSGWRGFNGVWKFIVERRTV